MAWHDELSADLPPPHEGEPHDLRRDILDELADHLHCAVDRELRRTDDPEHARQRALARFGNPQRIARRLWLDAMKERLMNQRILIGTNITIAIFMVALTVTLIAMLVQNQRFQASLVERLEAATTNQPSAPAEDAITFSWPTLEVRIVEEGSEQPVPDLNLILDGVPYAPGDKATLEQRSDAAGRVTFGPLRPGSYRLLCRDFNAIKYQNEITIPPGGLASPLVMVTPRNPPKTVPVRIALSLPNDIKYADFIATYRLAPRSQSNDGLPPNWQRSIMPIAIRGDGMVAPAFDIERQLNGTPFMTQTSIESLTWTTTVLLEAGAEYIVTYTHAWVSDFDELRGINRYQTIHRGADDRSRVYRVSTDGGATLTIEHPEGLIVHLGRLYDTE